jgi:hypothetical protein
MMTLDTAEQRPLVCATDSPSPPARTSDRRAAMLI